MSIPLFHVGAEVEPPPSVDRQRRRNRVRAVAVTALVLFVGLIIAGIDLTYADQWFIGVALALLIALWATWVFAPRAALAATVAFALVGDTITLYWFPFNKNLSSSESILYLADSVSLSPFELTLAWGLLVTGYRQFVTTGRPFRGGTLMWPLFALFALTIWGLVNGVFLQGGDRRVAMLEARPFLYLPLLYVLVINVCRTRRDYRIMFGAAIVAIFVQSLLSLEFLASLPPIVRDGLDSLNEHGSSIGYNLVFVALIVALLYRGVHPWARIGLAVAAVPTMIVYLVAQRRAAVVGLVIALGLVAVLLFWRQRRTFFLVVPVAALLFSGYLGAFWSSESSIGFPAQAVRSTVFGDDTDEGDSTSNDYRDRENYNLLFTIRTAPVAGIGFGKAFYRPVDLADISTFELNAYIPHNSLLYVWMKAGFAGLVTVMYLFARTIMLGAQRARHAPDGIDGVVAAAAATFAVMYAVFVYVDIAWEPRNILLMALAMGLCAGPLDEKGDPRHQRVGAGARDRTDLVTVG